MSSIYDVIVACCLQELWQFIAIPDAPAVQLTVETSSAFLTCSCESREAERQVVCYTRYAVKGPPERRAAVAEFVNLANWNLAIGNFELNVETGEVRFKTALDVDQETLTPGLIRPLIRSNLFTSDHYLPGYLKVAFRGDAPADVIEELDRYCLEDVVSDACRSLGV